jgi:hypothetical protein
MFSVFKSKHRRTVERAANELMEGFAKVCEAMNLQLDMLRFFDGKQRRDFLLDTYFVRYAFGMFDAVTMILGMHLRQKLGRGLIEQWFVPYIKIELGLAEPTARRVLENLFELYHKQDQRDTAITDGGFDGVATLQGRDAHRLADHFGFDSDAPVSPEQIQAFRTFHDRDRFSGSPE